MAFQKTKQVDNYGIEGNYWKIVQNNAASGSDRVVTLQLYVSQAGREEGKNPLPEQVKFNFTENDHPLSELDEATVDTTLVTEADVDNWYERFVIHCLYIHIKAIAVAAQAKLDADPDVELTANETNALFFIDALDV